MTGFLSELFSKLLIMSISASIVIIAIIFLRFILYKAPKSAVCVLWSLAAIRLILPFSIESSFSLMPSERNIGSALTAVSDGIGTVSPSLQQSAASAADITQQPPKNTFLFAEIVPFIWLAGLLFMLIFALVRFLRLKRTVRISIKSEDNVRCSDAVSSPFILGIFSPKIYLPSDIGEDEKRFILAHEKAHLKRHDHIIKPLAWLLLSVYWFNPLCIFAYILFSRDIESACDEKVINSLSFDGRKDYSRTLLKYSAQPGTHSICPLAFGEVNAKSRIKHILSYRKPTVWIIAAAVVLMCAAAAVFLTKPFDKPIIKPTENLTIDKTYFKFDSARLDYLYFSDDNGGLEISFNVKWENSSNENDTKLDRYIIKRLNINPDGSTEAVMLSDDKTEQSLSVNKSDLQTAYTYMLPDGASTPGKYSFTQTFTRNGKTGILLVEYSISEQTTHGATDDVTHDNKDIRSFERHIDRKKTVEYVYKLNPEDIMSCKLCLNNNMSFTMTFGELSSYIARGKYQYTDDGIKCITKDSGFEYLFRIIDNSRLSYSAEKSTQINFFADKGLIAVADGTVFTEKNNS